MGCSVDDLVVGMKVQSDPEVHKDDPLTTPFPWKEDNFQMVQEEDKSTIKIGILQESAFIPCSTAVKRGMQITEQALRDLGYKVEPFYFEDDTWRECTDIFMSCVCNGNTPGLIEDFTRECETWMAPLQRTALIFQAGFTKRMFIDFALTYIKNAGRQCRQLNGLRILHPRQFEEILKKRYEFVYKFAQMWRNAGITALISPIWPHSAPKAKNTAEMGLFLEYSLMWNLTGFPSGIIPVTKVLADEQHFTDQFKDTWTEVIHDDCQNSIDMPIGIQVVGYAFEDEKVLGIMKQLEEKIEYKIDMPPVIQSDLGSGQNLMDLNNTNPE